MRSFVLYTRKCENGYNSLVLLVDKPVGFSSYQIVRLLQSRYRKIGHAGTLDPCASGLLIMLTDQDTKRFQEYEGYEKEYCGEILLGMRTDTYDISGQFRISNSVHDRPSSAEINKVAHEFTGTIEQKPPRFSALKHRGRKFYELSRQGINVEPERRPVTIQSFVVTLYRYPLITFKAVVEKGVYIRSIAFDFGEHVGTGATLLSLRRQRIGNNSVIDSYSLGQLLGDYR